MQLHIVRHCSMSPVRHGYVNTHQHGLQQHHPDLDESRHASVARVDENMTNAVAQYVK